MLSIDEKVQIKPNGVFGALKENLMDSLNNIGAIGQFGSSKNWTIQFKDKASFDNNLGREIWRKALSHRRKSPFLTVLDVKSEKWEEGKSLIENGVYSVKVSYDIDDHDNFLNFAGFHRVEGLGALIQINGAGSKCLQCNKWGHVRKDCPNAKTKCASCNKTGHNASSCLVSKAKNNNNDEIQNEMEFENLVNEQDDEIKFVGEKKDLLNLTNKPFKVTTQYSILTVEIKKELMSENCEKVTKTNDSVVEKATAAPYSKSMPKLT